MDLQENIGRGASGRRTTTPIAPEAMSKALHDVKHEPWVEVATLATVLKIGLQSAYREARLGRFGAFKIGNLYRIPTPPLREALRLQPGPTREAA